MVTLSRVVAVGNRYLPAAIVLLSAVLIWWSVMVRLTGASAAELTEQRQRNIEFTLSTLSGRRDLLNSAVQAAGWPELEQRLVVDPSGLVPLLDRLLEIGTGQGISLRYDVGDRTPSSFDPAVGWRPVELEFNRVRYDQLLGLMRQMDGLTERNLFTVTEFALFDRARDGSLSGRLMVEVWTQLERDGSGPEHLGL